MSLTGLILQSTDYLLLVPGFALLNSVFSPKYSDWIDFGLCIAAVIVIYILAVWCVMLNYGVETI